MNSQNVTGKRGRASALNGSTPSELSSLATTMAKHSESRPESSRASRLSCSSATWLNCAMISDLTSIFRITFFPGGWAYRHPLSADFSKYSAVYRHAKPERSWVLNRAQHRVKMRAGCGEVTVAPFKLSV